MMCPAIGTAGYPREEVKFIMGTISTSNLKVAENSKLFAVLNAIQAASTNESSYIAYVDHSDYCIGLFDNG